MEQQRIGSPGGSNPQISGTSNAGPSSLASSGHSVADTAREQGHRALDKLRESAVSRAEDQKSMALEQVQHLAKGLRRTGETLRQEGSEPFGHLASSAADRVDRIANYLQRTDVDGLVDDVRLLARRNPAAVFGTALLAGVLVGRFLRSSRPSEHEVVFEPDPSLLDSGTGIGTSPSGIGTSGTMNSGLGTTGLGGPTTPGGSFGTSPTSGPGGTTSSGPGNGLGADRGFRGPFGGDPPSGGLA